MRVGMPCSPRMQPLARRTTRRDLLRIPGHGVIFGITAEYGSAAAAGPGGGERGGHAARAFLDFPAVGAQQIDIGANGFVLAPGRLGEVPDFQVEVRETLALLVDPRHRLGLMRT